VIGVDELADADHSTENASRVKAALNATSNTPMVAQRALASGE
jgi:hypothetical protein